MADKESAQPNSKAELGSVLQRQRIQDMADRCCNRRDGDLIEVGVYAGGTSTLLAQVARKYGRKLICVDNWKGGDSYELDKIGRIFKSDMAQYADVLILIEDDAHAPRVIEQIQSRRYCFAFSDDGHSFEAHVSELETLLPVTDGLICVDDTSYPGVTDAIQSVLLSGNFPGWEWLIDRRLREDWLVKT
jgi:cephalosporin hydroxylase